MNHSGQKVFDRQSVNLGMLSWHLWQVAHESKLRGTEDWRLMPTPSEEELEDWSDKDLEAAWEESVKPWKGI